MIAQLLNQPYLLDWAEAARDGLLEAIVLRSRRDGEASDLDGYDPNELDELAQELDAAISAEAAAAKRAGGKHAAGPQKNDLAFVPREPLLSLLQTAIDEYVAEREEGLLERKALPDGRRAATSEPVASNVVLKDAPIVAGGAEVRRKFEVRHPKLFSDPGYLLSGLAMLRREMLGPADFKDSPGGPVPIGDRARLVIVGDWGSGIERALKVRDQMSSAIKQGKAERRAVSVIHLGDVYYSGWKREYEKRFLDPWPVKPGEGDVRSFTLNGNHDMYSGGHGYFETCLADARFADQDRSSYFALRNGSWQFLALDTSYDDQALHGNQVDWVMRQLEENPDHKTVLLSHHQLFSAYEKTSVALATQVAPVLETKRIDGWFWGHEHRCLVYGKSKHLPFASCVGHGGIPEYLIKKEGDPLPRPLVYDYRKVWGDGREPWDTFGFVCVDLDGESWKLTYIDEDGDPHYPPASAPSRA